MKEKEESEARLRKELKEVKEKLAAAILALRESQADAKRQQETAEAAGE